jgi:hypothetical protein
LRGSFAPANGQLPIDNGQFSFVRFAHVNEKERAIIGIAHPITASEAS